MKFFTEYTEEDFNQKKEELSEPRVMTSNFRSEGHYTDSWFLSGTYEDFKEKAKTDYEIHLLNFGKSLNEVLG